MSKFNAKVEEGKVKLGFDSDEDGVNSVSLDIHLDEAIQEVLGKGEAVEGEAVVKFKIQPTGELSLSLDTDKDGQPSLDLKANIMEALNEAKVL